MGRLEWVERIGVVPTLAALDDVNRALWQAVAAGGVPDEDVIAVGEAVEARRAAIRAGISTTAHLGERRRQAPSSALAPSLFDHARSRDRARSRERRRLLAHSGSMPSPMASAFTVGELAVLTIISAEVQRRGFCDRCISELAARAGVSPTTVRNAVRQATRLGLVTVEHRPQRGTRSLSNIVRIISREWRQWLNRRSPAAPGGGCRKVQPTEYKHKTQKEKEGLSEWRKPESLRKHDPGRGKDSRVQGSGS